MSILVLTQTEVESLLPMRECIEVMAGALSSLSRGEMQQPLRTVLRPEDAGGLMALMPAFRSGANAMFGLKAICVFPGNPSKGKDAHQGGVMLFSGETGEPLALMNASAITAVRTAAVSAVATRALARENASDLAIIGSGVQARSHLEAMTCVRTLSRARVASRSFAHAQKFADEEGARYSFPVEAVETVEEALRGADLIVTATTAQEPVLNRSWIARGTHINAVGTYSPAAREIDTETILDARLFVDRRESALNEAGDYLIPALAGVIGPQHIVAELGELITGIKTGRQTQDEITIFKSLGLAVEDLAAAEYLYQKARQVAAAGTDASSGTWAEF